MSGAEFFMGLGYESGADPADVLRLAEQACALAGIAASELAVIASLDSKAEDGMVTAIGRHFGCRTQHFSAAILEAETPRLLNPSEAVFRQIGCHGVAEAAALAAAGPNAALVVPKTKGDRATCAIARRGVDGR